MAAVARVTAMSEAQTKAELVARLTQEYFEGKVKAKAESGTHTLELPARTEEPESRRFYRKMKIGEAVLDACVNGWLSPNEIKAEVERRRPGTNEASVHPEIMRLKNDGRLLTRRDGRYKTA